jgi:hypothetical protein
MINNNELINKQLNKTLIKSGYELISLEDNGRTYLGKAKKNNLDYYIKLAKSKRENLRLQNDVAFNQELEKLNPPFSIPKVVDIGNLFGDFYFKMETKVVGKPFAILKKDISQLQVKNPKQYFLQIYQMIDWLQKQKIVLPTSFDQQLHAFHKKDRQNAINTMIDWSFNVTPRLSDLLKIVQANKSALEEVTAHRDITPINIIIAPGGNVGLVDADIADTTAPKYYDFAEFYNRLWTRVCRPDLAKEFLQLVINNLKDDKAKFYHQLLAILAVRAVGNYWETMQLKENQQKRIKFLTSFAEHVADKKFLNQRE